MSLDPVLNFAKVQCSQGYDADDTSIVLSSGEGAKLPQPSTDGAFNLVWWNSTDYSDPADDPNVEIVRVTARSTDTLTVTRGQESIAATTKNTASKTYKMVLAMTKKMKDDIEGKLVVSVIRKTADESVTSNTTLQDDDHLLFNIAVNEVWYVEYVLFGTDAAGFDFKFTVAVPSGATGKWWDVGQVSVLTAGGVLTGTSFGTTISIDTGAADKYILLYAYVFNGATAGQVKLQWAQTASEAGAATLYANSFLRATKIA